MTDENTAAGAEPAETGNHPDPGPPMWFIKTVGLLMLVIIAALTGLALRMHRRATLAEAEVRQLRRSAGQLNPTLSQMLKLKPGDRLRLTVEGAEPTDNAPATPAEPQ